MFVNMTNQFFQRRRVAGYATGNSGRSATTLWRLFGTALPMRQDIADGSARRRRRGRSRPFILASTFMKRVGLAEQRKICKAVRNDFARLASEACGLMNKDSEDDGYQASVITRALRELQMGGDEESAAAFLALGWRAIS